MIRKSDCYATVQEYRAQKACAWLMRNYSRLRAEFWKMKDEATNPVAATVATSYVRCIHHHGDFSDD